LFASSEVGKYACFPSEKLKVVALRKKKVKNKLYRQFLDGEIMKTIPKDEFIPILDKVKHPSLPDARALLILLWSTGARPNEVLRLTRGDLEKKNNRLKVKMPGSKGGTARIIMLPIREPIINEVWKTYKNNPNERVLFWRFRSNAKRNGTTRVNYVKDQFGVEHRHVKHYPKQYQKLSSNLYHFVKKWFGVPPYYFRHNRLTIAAETETPEQLRQLKGSKTFESIIPYLHLSEKQARRISKVLVK
jgi:integrase